MKKRIIFVLTLILAALLLASCRGGQDSVYYYTVKFDSNGGGNCGNRQYTEGDLIFNPPIPSRPGYTFIGWYNGEELWDFETDVVESNMTLSAKWKRLSYTVVFNSNGGSAVEEQTINSGDKATRPSDPTREDYIFVGWFDSTGEEWSFNNRRVTENITLTARWEACETHTVTFDANGGTPTAPQYIADGKKASEPKSPTKADNAFVGWFYGETEWDFDSNEVTQDITLVAKWNPIKTFTVCFDSKGGSSIPPQYVAVGEQAIRPNAPATKPNPNAIFVGWFYGDTEWNFSTVITADMTLTAKWIIRYTVVFDTNGSDEPIPDIHADEGDLIIKPQDPTKADSRFIGWYNGEVKWNFATDKVTCDITLKAKWEPVPTYTVTFDANGGSAVNSQNVREGGFVVETGSERDGYRLDGWYYTSDSKEVKWDFARDTVNSKITLTAKWIEVVKVTYDIDGAITELTIDKGQALVKPEDPKKDGYIFQAWIVEESGVEWNYNEIVNSKMTITAKFLIKRTVTFDTDGGTAVPPIEVADGHTIQKPVTSKNNHRFDGWYIKGTQIKWNFSTDTVTEDIVLVAHWIPTLPIDPFD